MSPDCGRNLEEEPHRHGENNSTRKARTVTQKKYCPKIITKKKKKREEKLSHASMFGFLKKTHPYLGLAINIVRFGDLFFVVR